MVDYTVTFKQDVYYLENTGTNALGYTLKTINDCTTVTAVVTTGTLDPIEIFTLPLTVDSIYELTVQDLITLETSTSQIKYFQNLELAMIQDTFAVLCDCDCGCKDCVDKSSKPCFDLMTARNRAEMYVLLSSPRYNGYYAAAMKSAVCYTSPQLYCGLSQEWVSGTSSYNEKLSKQLLALNYLGIYSQEIAGLTDTDDIDYVNGKFLVDSIFCCITELGVDISEVFDSIGDSIGTVTINVGGYINQPPTTGSTVLTTLNRTPLNIQLSDFPYSDPEGTAITAIRIESLLSGIPVGTLTWNGVDVVVGQVITDTDFILSPLLFTPPDTNLTDSDVFTYSARDADGLWSTD